MKTCTVRDLRTEFPRIESWVAAGESVSITKHGRPVATLVAPQVGKRPNFAVRFGGKAPAPRAGVDMASLLADDRGE